MGIGVEFDDRLTLCFEKYFMGSISFLIILSRWRRHERGKIRLFPSFNSLSALLSIQPQVKFRRLCRYLTIRRPALAQALDVLPCVAKSLSKFHFRCWDGNWCWIQGSFLYRCFDKLGMKGPLLRSITLSLSKGSSSRFITKHKRSTILLGKLSGWEINFSYCWQDASKAMLSMDARS